MTTAPNNSTILKIGSQFDGGKVTGIFTTGVKTIKGSFTRFYEKAEVEAKLQSKELVK